MEITPVSAQYTQTSKTQRTDESQQAQNRAVREQQQAAAQKVSQKSQPVINGQGQTIGGLLNTSA